MAPPALVLPTVPDIVPAELAKCFRAAADKVRRTAGVVRVASHYDTDGLCSGALVCMALRREGIPYHISIYKGMSPEDVDALAAEDAPLYIVCDMGTGMLARFSPIAERTVILEHHVPGEPNEKVLEINCHRFKVDGTKHACASTLAFLLAIELRPASWDLLPVAVAGMIGDKQNIETGFQGVNLKLVGAGLDAGLIDNRSGLRLDGATVGDAIVRSTAPYLSGLADRPEMARAWCGRFGIDPLSPLPQDGSAAAQRLSSALVLKLVSQGTRPEIVEDLFKPRLVRSHDGADLGTLADLVDACGRRGLTGLGLAWAMGDTSKADEVNKIRSSHDDRIRALMVALEDEAPKTMKAVHVLDVANDSFAGIVAGLAMQYLLPQDKPTLALSVTPKELKVSARGTGHLVNRGLNLAEALNKAATEMGGRGGGHPVAAGANVPIAARDAFLDKVDGLIAWQLGKHDKK